MGKAERTVKIYGGVCEYCGGSIYFPCEKGGEGVCEHVHNQLPDPENPTAGIAYLAQVKKRRNNGHADPAGVLPPMNKLDAEVAKAADDQTTNVVDSAVALDAAAPAAKAASYPEMQTEAKELNKHLPEDKKIKIGLKKPELIAALDAGYATLRAASSDGEAETGEIAA